MKDLALLLLRLTTGGLMAGHGAQKLFGAFGGHGIEGTAGWLESLGLRPGERWAYLAALSEFGGGLLTAFGLFSPAGPIGIASSMMMAATTAHADKPIWVTEGGAELPLTNKAVAAALALAGPGRYSLDHVFGIKLPRGLVALMLVVAGLGVWRGITRAQMAQSAQPAMQQPETAGSV